MNALPFPFFTVPFSHKLNTAVKWSEKSVVKKITVTAVVIMRLFSAAIRYIYHLVGDINFIRVYTTV